MSRNRALMSPRINDGPWRVFVQLPELPNGPWPEFVWPAGSAIPTPAERREALAGLGYQPAAGAEWEWMEMDLNPDSQWAVRLLAAIDVDPAGGDR
ncbi:DUF6303 family protein [Streptomyces sp. NPDC020917]|uniref:DUF6303 family protein n=1 Tax=Streptomyces sp. NPDC020917 TaxID=3365102 RepID=UPI0037A53D4B